MTGGRVWLPLLRTCVSLLISMGSQTNDAMITQQTTKRPIEVVTDMSP